MLLDLSPSTPKRNTLTAPLAAPPVKVVTVSRGKLSNISTFRTKTRHAIRFEFDSVDPWHDFEFVMQKNLFRIRHFDRNAWELSLDSQFASKNGTSLSTVLEKNNIQANFLSVPPAGQVGSSDLSVTLNGGSRPVLVGLHKPKSEISRRYDASKLCKLYTTPENELSESDKSYVCAVHEIASLLLVNDLRMGYVSTFGFTHFLMISNSDEGKGLKLSISGPIPGDKSTASLMALVLEAYFKTPYIDFHKGFELSAETRPDPPLHMISQSAAVPGKVRWWVVNKLNALRYFVCLNSSAGGCYYFNPTFGIYLGTIYEVAQPGLQQTAIFKVASGSQAHIENMKNEASMFEYLNSKHLNVLPQRIVYGTLFDRYHILAFKPFGRQVTKTDLSLKTMEQMRYALRTLHAYNVRHCDIRLESFFIDHDDTIRIANLGRAQKFKFLPDVARDAEMELLEQLFK